MNTRLTNLRALMKVQKLDAVFVSSIPNIIYLTGFSAFTTEDRDAFLLITQRDQFIFTHGIYKEAVKKNIKGFTLIEMSRENPTGRSIEQLIHKHDIKKLGYEATNLTVWEYERLFKHVNNKILTDANPVEKIREIKDFKEINAIQKACILGDKAYSYILKNLRIGMTEKEVAFEIEYFIKKNGGEISFSSIVAFGANAAYIHHLPGDKKLEKNECVLLDFGVKLKNYCSDMSRTFFYGKATSEQRNVYQTALNSQQKAITYIEDELAKNEKAQGSTADKIAREHIASRNFEAFPYSLGHGIGLEVHESPRLTPAYEQTLENGMVFSIEPGIYLTDKFGVRIEDLFAIQNNKLVPLTHSPKELMEI